MHLVRSLALAGLLLSLVGCRSNNGLPQQDLQVRAPIRIQLDGSNPAASEGVLDRAEEPLRFTVGHGRHGIACEGTTFEDLDETPLPDPAKDLVPLEVPAGTMVILNGKLPHWSDVNRSPVSRHAYTLHCISASATYPDWNWLQRPADMPLRRLDRSDRQ